MLIYGITKLIELDFMFFIDLALNNLYFFFGFALAAAIFFKGKHIIPGFLLIMVITWSFGDFLTGTGWIFPAAAAFFVVTTRTIWVKFTENHLSPRTFGILLTFQFVVVFTIFNLFMV